MEYVKEPNFEGFVVIGAGLPRTGTASLRTALSIILQGPIYHMYEVFENKNDSYFWSEALERPKTGQDWKEFYEGRGFRGGLDYPQALFYKELMDVFPKAKVILTVRDPESWYRSVRDTLYQSNLTDEQFPVNVFWRINGMFCIRKMLRKLATKNGNRFRIGLHDAIGAGEETSVDFFNQWIEEVKKSVPKERLLIFNVKEGWQPLCQFLDIPIPDCPFPNVNDTQHMKKRFRNRKITAYLTVIGFPILTACLAYFATKLIK